MRLLVTGSNGQVARALGALALADVEVVLRGRPDLDIVDRASVEHAIAETRPDLVVNPAAYTAVDKAESEPDLAFAANRDGAANVAAAAARHGLPVIHLSTDYVFSGEAGRAYVESDPTEPTGVYGASKLAGERAVAASNPAHAILRTAWVYAPWGHNFLKTMLRLAATRDTVRVVADQHGTPTYAPHIAEAIVAVARGMLASPDKRGVFHMTAGGATTWAGFAEAIFERSAALGGPSARVERIATADYPTPARRPANSRLDSGRFQRLFGVGLPRWEEGVGDCLQVLAREEAWQAHPILGQDRPWGDGAK